MKKLLKIFLPILVISVAVSLLFIPAEAATSAGGYAVWASEEAYLENPNSPKIKSSSNDIKASDIQNGAYLLAYGDLSLPSTTNVQIVNGATVVIDLGGHTLTSAGNLTIGSNGGNAPTYLTVKNGTVEHVSAQFFKPQPNSETVIENVVLNDRSTWGNLIYGDSFRSFVFRNSVINYSAAGTGCNITPPYNAEIGMFQSYLIDPDRDYVMSIVFDNSNFNVIGGGNFIYFRDIEDTHANLDIAFINGSSFNELNSSFLSWEVLFDSNVNVYIEKGTKFNNPEVPIEGLNSNCGVSYYNSLEFDGQYLILGEKTSLAPVGHANTPGSTPLLIWGFSGDGAYPHSLCNYLYTATFYNSENEPIAIDMNGYAGYADGVTVDISVLDESYVIKNVENVGNRVFKRVQAGWSPTPERTTYTENATITGNSNFYLVLEDVGPAVIVEYADMELQSITSAIFENTLSDADLANFTDGSYLYIYDDVKLVSESSAVVVGTLNLDLGGNTLTKNKAMADSIAAFDIVGGTVNVRNGRINVSTTGFVSIRDGGTLNLSDVEVSFDSYPAFTVAEGAVNMVGTDGSAITGRTDDVNVPAFLLSKLGGASAVNISNTEVSVAGPLMTHSSDGELADIDVNISDCDKITALSVFKVYSSVADKLNRDSTLELTLDGCKVETERVFDVSSRSDGTPSVIATFNISDSVFTSDPRDLDCGTVVCPMGYVVLASGTDGYKYSIAPSGVEMKFNLALSLDFVAKFYIRKDDSLRYVDTYLGRSLPSELEVTSIEGAEYYVVSLGGISASDSLETITLHVGFVGSDSAEYSARFEYSPIDYFDELLNGNDPLARKLSAAAMAYVAKAYAYRSCELPESFSELLVSEKYSSELRGMNEIPTVLDFGRLGNISAAFCGVQLYLSSNISFRFNLRSDFTGTITVSGVTYSVTNGRVGELAYIEVSPDAPLWYSASVAITGSAESGAAISGEYSLLDYATSTAAEDPSLSELLAALYAYCYEAGVYTDGGVIPPYIEGTPAVDVTYR